MKAPEGAARVSRALEFSADDSAFAACAVRGLLHDFARILWIGGVGKDFRTIAPFENGQFADAGLGERFRGFALLRCFVGMGMPPMGC